MQKTRRFFSKLTAAVLAGAMLVSGGAVSMTVSAASAKPVLNTDVTVPSAGNVLIGMEGTYAHDIKAALDLVNQYRREACNNGYPNPENGKKLTPSDYVPMQWSAGLEYLARIRAAESSQTIAHERTNGSHCFTIQTPGGYSSGGECLAWWSWGLDMKSGVEQGKGRLSEQNRRHNGTLYQHDLTQQPLCGHGRIWYKHCAVCQHFLRRVQRHQHQRDVPVHLRRLHTDAGSAGECGDDFLQPKQVPLLRRPENLTADGIL